MRRWLRGLIMLVSVWCLVGTVGFVWARWSQHEGLVEVFAPMAQLGLQAAAALVIAVPLIGAFYMARAHLGASVDP